MSRWDDKYGHFNRWFDVPLFLIGAVVVLGSLYLVMGE